MGVSFLGTLKDMQRGLWRWNNLSLCRGSVRGTWKGGFFSGDFERYVKRALEMEHLSLCRGSIRGTWKGGFLFWGL
jgi:hypothetical protein